jgi:hypothetical protein
MTMEKRDTGHLTDDELFGLALPPAGEPEALPAHLLHCARCGRALQEWKSAVREIARDEVEPLSRRSPEEWRAAEDRTLERIRWAGSRRPPRGLHWAVGVAAALLLVAFLLPAVRNARERRASVSDSAAASELSAADAADDQLLRDVARLSRDDDGGVAGGLVPDPSADAEDRL